MKRNVYVDLYFSTSLYSTYLVAHNSLSHLANQYNNVLSPSLCKLAVE